MYIYAVTQGGRGRRGEACSDVGFSGIESVGGQESWCTREGGGSIMHAATERIPSEG